jgi:hypothetical protein
MSAITEIDSCVFCNIIRGNDKEARILYQDDEVIVIRDKFPVALHHILVLPVRHIKNAKHLTPEDLNLGLINIDSLYLLSTLKTLILNFSS